MERALRAFQLLTKAVAVPLLVLNLLGGIGSAIWLMILGEWAPLGYGVASLFVSPFVVGLAFMPSVLFLLPMSALVDRGQTLPVVVLGFLSNMYLGAIITVWCVLVFAFFMGKATHSTFWPLLIWSYGIAVAPVGFLASKEPNNWASQMTLFYVEVGYLCMMFTVIVTRVTIIELAIVCGAVMFLGFTFSWYLLAASGELTSFVRQRNQKY